MVGWGIEEEEEWGEGEEWGEEDEGRVEVVGWGEVRGEERRRGLRLVLESWPSAVLGVSGCRSCGGTGSRGRWSENPSLLLRKTWVWEERWKVEG